MCESGDTIFCYECKISDIRICNDCANKKDICLNCIAYGDGDYCSNCIQSYERDEGIDMKNDLYVGFEWIERNNNFWKLRFLLTRLAFSNNFVV